MYRLQDINVYEWKYEVNLPGHVDVVRVVKAVSK
jgi:hypothetical protein